MRMASIPDLGNMNKKLNPRFHEIEKEIDTKCIEDLFNEIIPGNSQI